MLAIIEDGVVTRYPYSETDFRRDNPNTSFPDQLSEALLEERGAVRVHSDVQPPYDQATQNVVEGTPFFNEYTQRWTQSWVVEEANVQEIELRAAAKSDQIRAERNQLIADSDWTQLPDSPVDKEAWAAYRQALRDIPEQQGFPWDVEWPTPPS